jgi:hypothetical protein
MSNELFVNDQYEKELVKEFNLLPNDNRELNVLGTYTPVKGIYSLGWDKWKEEPAAELVIKLKRWHDGFSKDHSSEPFYPIFGPLILNGELNHSDLVILFKYLMAVTSQNFVFEGVSHARAHLLGAREVRDIIARHLFEEVGHNEMLAEFMVGAFGMDRVREVNPLADPTNFDDDMLKLYIKFKSLNESGHFVELAAASMLMERYIPRPHRQMAIGFRKHYNVPNKFLTFFDIHSYIDIYHERFGSYILAKYAIKKELQDMATKAYETAVVNRYNSWKRIYERMSISKK